MKTSPSETLLGRQRPNEDTVAAAPAMKITRLETMLVKPRWLFLKMHTDAGLLGYG